MSKTVKIFKIGDVTRVYEYYSENPAQSRVLNIGCASLELFGDKIIVKGENLSFTYHELDDTLGAGDLVEVMDKFADYGFFGCGGGSSQSATGFITLAITSNANVVQSPLLVGKSAINMVVVANTTEQDVIGYNSGAGSFIMNVSAGDILTIFFTN